MDLGESISTVCGSVLLTAVTSGCAVEASEDFATKSQKATVIEDWVLKSRVVRTCFFEPTQYPLEQSWIRSIMKGQHSWEDAGRVTFVFLPSCDGTQDVEIEWTDFSSNADPRKSPVVVKIQAGPRSTSEGDKYIEETHRQCSDHGLSHEQCVKTIALHEFGHVLGFAHENTREDAPCPRSVSDWSGDTDYGADGYFDYDSIMLYSENNANCSSNTRLSALDRGATYFHYGTREGAASRLGDFNGDGRADMICHDNISGDNAIDFASPSLLFNGIAWTNHLVPTPIPPASLDPRICRIDNGRLFTGDFNGDGQTDAMCHNLLSGALTFDYASRDGWAAFRGRLMGVDRLLASSGWCVGDSDQVLVGDFDGDGRDDLLCRDSATGVRNVRWGSNNYDTAVSASSWCTSTKTRVLVGDFNGDGRDDLLCHGTPLGKKVVSLTDPQGQLSGNTWVDHNRWCAEPGELLHVGDFDGDGRDDMLCHAPRLGYKWIKFADESGFFTGGSYYFTQPWCKGGEERLHVGDVNNDGPEDLVCHNTRTGAVFVDLALGGQSWFAFDGNSDLARDDDWCIGDSEIVR